MSTINELLKQIEGKLRVLKFTQGETHRVLDSEKEKAIERHAKVFEDLIEQTHQLKVQAQQSKIENGDAQEEVTKWSLDIENEIAAYEQAVDEIKERIANQHAKAKDEEEKIEQEKRRLLFEEELKMEKAKLELKQEFEKKMEESYAKSAVKGNNAKLPKLVITKFQGTHLDWQRFWGQFETEIDKAEISQIAKLSYLKELVEPRVRTYIDGLPFTIEGYERAKSIMKSKFGKPSEVANAHMQGTISLPLVKGSHPKRIHEFFESLVTNTQALETMGKISQVNGFVRPTLDKLPGIRADLVRLDDEWQEWGFPQLVEALRKWCERNPVISEEQGGSDPRFKGGKFLHLRQEQSKPRPCVYCNSDQHKSVACDKMVDVASRKKELAAKKRCFNCTGLKHRASECRSLSTCLKCKAKHHTSICDQAPKQIMLATSKGRVIYPVVVVMVDGVKCRALLDTGAGSSYISSGLVKLIGKKPNKTEFKKIDMMLCTTTQKIECYNVKISNVQGTFELTTQASKVDKNVLLSIPNPQYSKVISENNHLREVSMDDNDTKPELPISMILGASDYSKIKTNTEPKLGEPGEPVGELTKLGWTIMAAGEEEDLSNVYLAKSSTADYEQLCGLDVLGLQDEPMGNQQSVYQDFKEQLRRSDEGWYETGLLWKPRCDKPLPSNESNSVGRLNNLLKKLQRDPETLDQYHTIIQKQLQEGIVERVVEEAQGREYYIPHKPVVRKTAESTKMRIVYDASAKASENAPSLNDCLETGPPLQNLLWNVLLRNRLKPVALSADIKQAFLQVRIRPEDRDSLRFHWIKDKQTLEIEILRFTRALFGLVQSPFLLGATIQQHLDSLREKYPSEVEEIERSLYVDDIISGGDTREDVIKLKGTVKEIFGQAKFQLHKWHSNVSDLEETVEPASTTQSYAKDQLGVKPDETKLLGLPWNKVDDVISVSFPDPTTATTKREILRFLSSIYDPLGLASPITLVGKFIYRDVCDLRIPWDAEISQHLSSRWLKFQQNLPDKLDFPRSLVSLEEPIEAIDLHAFGDSSKEGTSAAVYAVVQQASGVRQGLIAAKSRLAKKDLTIPRLELVSAHMATNLVDNTKQALDGYPVRSVTGWLDSSVALYWIKGRGSYKQFVSNRVKKINAKEYINWRHVKTDENPADLGSRGCRSAILPETWLKGPIWLSQPEQWSADIHSRPSEVSEAEAKLTKELFVAAEEIKDDLDSLLESRSFWRAARVFAWIVRFIRNCKLSKTKRTAGPLTTPEIQARVHFWIQRATEAYSKTDKFNDDRSKLNLKLKDDGLYECRGRIHGNFPIYFTTKRSDNRENRSQCPRSESTWGSWFDDGVHTTKILGSPAASTREEGHTELLWLQEVPRRAISSPSRRSTTHRPHRWISSF